MSSYQPPIPPISPPPSSRRRSVILIVAIVVIALAAGAVVWVTQRSEDPAVAEPAATSAAETTSVAAPNNQVVLEQAGEPADDPFFNAVAVTEVAAFPDAVVTVISEQRRKLPTDPATGVLTITGSADAIYGGNYEAAVYGGSKQLSVCDVPKLSAFLTSDPIKAAAWAGVLGIEVETIPDYLPRLTPVTLLHDTAVTNYGFADGEAVGYQAVLQAGTAVLVDDYGQPVVRCACGNPLAAPQLDNLAEADVLGEPWPGYAAETTVIVKPGLLREGFTLLDTLTGETYQQPVGSGPATAKDTPGLLVVTSPAGIATSPDGITWTINPDTPPVSEIAYGDGLLVAGYVGTEDFYAHLTTSTDGLSWTEPVRFEEPIQDIAYDSGTWVVLASGGEYIPDASLQAVIYTSTDAVAWDRREISLATTEYGDDIRVESIAVGNGQWLIGTGGYQSERPLGPVFHSVDGLVWTELPWSDPNQLTKGFNMQWVWTGETWGATGHWLSNLDRDTPPVVHGVAGLSPDATNSVFNPRAPSDLWIDGLTWDAGRGWIAAGSTFSYDNQVYLQTSGVYASTDLVNWTPLGGLGAEIITDIAVLPGTLPVVAPAPTAAPTTTSAPTSEAPVGPDLTGLCVYEVPGETGWLLEPIGRDDVDCELMMLGWAEFLAGDTTSASEVTMGCTDEFGPNPSYEQEGFGGSCSVSAVLGFDGWLVGSPGAAAATERIRLRNGGAPPTS